MGTNYYLVSKSCPTCAHTRNEIHIGKASAGWRFLFQAHGFDGPSTFKEWLIELRNPLKHIRDEYGEIIEAKDLIDEIQIRQKYKIHTNDKYFYTDENGYDFSLNEFS